MFPGFFLSLLSILTGGPGDAAVVRRIVMQDTVVFRIPVRPPPPPNIEWKESKGPKCLMTGQIMGATLRSPGDIDFVLNDRSRVRAELDSDCSDFDFYKGFYVEPEDERLCAKRDALRSRMGGTCEIRRFRTLTPRLKR